MKVFIYWNLHKHCWSVKALNGENRGRVIMHAMAWKVTDVTFKVSEAGRQRVLREKRKNVHAGVVGHLVSYTNTDGHSVVHNTDMTMPAGKRISYNPYRFSTFFDVESLIPLHTAPCAMAEGRTVVI